jgi:hypothetical protein
MMPGLREELLRTEIQERARRSQEAGRLASSRRSGRRRAAEEIRHAAGAFLIRSGVRLLPDSAAVRIPAPGD